MTLVVAVFTTWALAFALAGLWEWFAFVLLAALALALGELYAIRRTGLTLSHIWLKESKRRPQVMALLTALLALGLVLIGYHLWTGWG
ncbi:MAG: hypothetical protein NZ821_08850 [Gloeomargarita sp. SKYB31]|nr:hypothetical protein [Gloeomargarita sp. SKYB31]